MPRVHRNDMMDSMTIVCMDCQDKWSHSWPRSGPSRRRNAERTMVGYGWKRVWGGWRCRECRQARAKRTVGRAPWVRWVGVGLGIVAGVIVALGVWL